MGLVHNTNVVSDGLIGYWDAANRRSYPGAGITWTDLVGVNNGTLENRGGGGGALPSFDSNWQGGFFCPCHGSKFDLAGRVYKNVPAPTNLEVPPHSFLSEGRVLIGVSQIEESA